MTFKTAKSSSLFIIFCVLFTALTASCSRKLGWGVLLWANDEANIPSGAVLPVYTRSNIEKKWIAGIPEEYRVEGKSDKVTIPLPQLELVGGRGAARKYAAGFGEYTLVYAETLQDGLPIRSAADNSAGRVYRLRIGEIVKVLTRAEGAPAISTTGEPLPGEWYQVLTEDGTRGYCFSYRLRLFDHTTGPLNFAQTAASELDDRLLQSVQSKVWSTEIYSTMLNDRKFDIDALSKHWGFSTGEDTGIANVYTREVDRSFQYSAIRSIGERAWRFEGSSLTMTLLTDTMLSVQFIDRDGMSQSARFVSLPVSVNDLISQEERRRDDMYAEIFAYGPDFSSSTFGKLIITEDADFLWEDFELLVPDYIPVSALGRGKMEIRYNLSDELQREYTGVVSMRFKTIGSADRTVNFLYKLGGETGTEGGMSFEFVPPESIKDGIVYEKEDTAMIIYFFKTI
ncbi:MAG: SH3 domain-containing protein [Spirochaetaceae bacterium]|jgi:hypothetical protein|nr:SH3 domain-containing protein [Spirochaetaceae bacterium]